MAPISNDFFDPHSSLIGRFWRFPILRPILDADQSGVSWVAATHWVQKIWAHGDKQFKSQWCLSGFWLFGCGFCLFFSILGRSLVVAVDNVHVLVFVSGGCGYACGFYLFLLFLSFCFYFLCFFVGFFCVLVVYSCSWHVHARNLLMVCSCVIQSPFITSP